MKKYPDDTLPSLAIQFVCFTVLFVTWILGDIGWKHGPSGIVDWLGQVPAILQTPGTKSEFSRFAVVRSGCPEPVCCCCLDARIGR